MDGDGGGGGGLAVWRGTDCKGEGRKGGVGDCEANDRNKQVAWAQEQHEPHLA